MVGRCYSILTDVNTPFLPSFSFLPFAGGHLSLFAREGNARPKVTQGYREDGAADGDDDHALL